MVLFAAVWVYLLTISQSKVITVNDGGNNSTDCCKHGGCVCGSFSDALKYLENNTIVNITSQSVPLHGYNQITTLNNITIAGNGATIMCNNSGILSCINCSNVVIRGTTWDQCGDTSHQNFTHGLGFRDVSNISIASSTFQYSGVCTVVVIFITSDSFEVQNSNFLYNHVVNSTGCKKYSSLFVANNDFDGSPYMIFIANTAFHHNGVFSDIKYLNEDVNGMLYINILQKREVKIYLANSTISTAGNSLGIFAFCSSIKTLTVNLYELTVVNNSYGGSVFTLQGTNSSLAASSCTFAHNKNGSFKLRNFAQFSSVIYIKTVSIIHNEGTFGVNPILGDDGVDEGVGIFLLVRALGSSIKLLSCNIQNNFGGQRSIVYIRDFTGPLVYQLAIMDSLNFTDNIGPALRMSVATVTLEGLILYEGNSAESGAAVYIDGNSQVAIREASTIKFINNTASLHGGAIYVDLPLSCTHHGVVFTSLSSNSDVVFINNSAGVTGNSMYFSIPESCDVIRDYNDSNSIAYIPYKFNYSGLGGPEISASPYQIKLCSSPGCDTNSDNTRSCFIQHGNMLGQSISFNATVCDYFDNVAETVQFDMECINCNNAYRLYNNRILAHDRSSTITIISVESGSDLHNNMNITINMSSVLSQQYKPVTATLSLELTPCHSGFLFDVGLQQCSCYGNVDIIQCQEDYAEIKQGYWFGDVFGRRTASLCPQYYCEFSSDAETRTGYYRLPINQDGQCSPHRTGPACGECSPGYSLSYDTPDCVSNNNCSAGITVLVMALTILYWIAVVVVIFALMYFINNAPIGYAYGIIYYYSIVDILLGNNLYISDGVFQLVSILSSFAKLSPQFLGKLCLVQGLSGIDQQFIRFSHAIAVFILVLGTIIATECSAKLSKHVGHCIIRVICLLLLLAYTSIATTSLQLLRPLYYQDIDGVYVYLSPLTEYFHGRHIAYTFVALCCEVFVVHGLILFLLLEPFLRKKFTSIKIKAFVEQLQGCYKYGYQWFSVYYLLCRQIIILIVYINSSYDTALYCLQTFCVITVAIHVWVQPYKSTSLNVTDGIILLKMVLVVNLNTFSFSRSSIIVISVILIIFPLSFAALAYMKNNLYAFVKMCYQSQKNHLKRTADDFR